MEVVEQLDYLVTNAEVMELLKGIDAEATSAGFMRPPIARETSKQVTKLRDAANGGRVPECAKCACVNVRSPCALPGAATSRIRAILQYDVARGRQIEREPQCVCTAGMHPNATGACLLRRVGVRWNVRLSTPAHIPPLDSSAFSLPRGTLHLCRRGKSLCENRKSTTLLICVRRRWWHSLQ